MAKMLGIDMGSANTAFCIEDENEIKTSASLIAIEEESQRILATGNEARKMVGRTPASIQVISPIKEAMVDDAEAATSMMSELIARLEISPFLKQPGVLATIPYGLNKSDENVLASIFHDARASTVDFVETPMAIALGAGMPLDLTTGKLVVDIGAGHSSASIISHGGIVLSSSIHTAGNAMTEAVAKHVADVHGIEVGPLTAEMIKVNLATLSRSTPQKSIKIYGKVKPSKDAVRVNKFTASAVITSHELIPVLSPIVDDIIKNIKKALESANSEISSDVSDFGILLSGGVAAMNGLAGYIEQMLHVKVHTTKAPAFDAVKGTLRIINGGHKFAKFTKRDCIR